MNGVNPPHNTGSVADGTERHFVQSQSLIMDMPFFDSPSPPPPKPHPHTHTHFPDVLYKINIDCCEHAMFCVEILMYKISHAHSCLYVCK